MNCNSNRGYPVRTPGSMAPCPPSRPMPFFGPSSNFPVGMGYVPVQMWENPYPIERGFSRGTIFPSLDYPFVMGRCR